MSRKKYAKTSYELREIVRWSAWRSPDRSAASLMNWYFSGCARERALVVMLMRVHNKTVARGRR